MKIKKLMLKNFRAYKSISIDLDSDLNVITGKNDVGKSTILEAMDIFLEGGSIKMDRSDLNVSSEEKKIQIGLTFEIERERKYLLDASVKTSLEEESLLNKDGHLDVYKEWDCSKDTITSKSLSIYFRSYYFNEFKENPLIALKNSDLKNELKKRGLICSNKKINSEIRKSIYSSLENEKREKEEICIQVDKEDAKKIWESIKKEIPMFFLFQSDRANKDSDKEVQNPLKAIAKQAVSSVEKDLSAIKSRIEDEINKLGELTMEKLKEMAPEAAKNLEPKITNKPWESLFSFSFDDDRSIPINKRGSGIRRLILLNYFRAEAERRNTEGKHVIYAIEEPETSQHPNYQIMLVESLKKLGEKEKTQVFITTHTPEIAKLCCKQNLILLEKNDHEISAVSSDEKKMEKIAQTLGVLPYLNKFSIFVEGMKDVRFLMAINKNISELRAIADLENLSVLPLIGGNLINWVNKGYIKKANIKSFYLYDNDDPKNTEAIQKINNKNDENFAQTTKFLAMENYFSPSLIENEFRVKFSEEEKKNWKNEKIVKLVRKQKPKLTETDIKNKIHAKLVNQVSKTSLEEIGAWDEARSWFEKIKEMNNEG